MKFAIAKEHRDHFQRSGSIEFENFLSADQLSLFNQAIDQSLSKRLGALNNKKESLDQQFLNGRDLWRGDEPLRKLIFQPYLAAVASELVEKRPIRLGYDQFFAVPQTSQLSASQEGAYAHFLRQTASLEAISSIEGLLCGLMLCLSMADPKFVHAEDAEGADIFPTQAGHALFFQPQLAVNWGNLYRHPGQCYYLLVYTASLSQYRLNAGDPHAHALQAFGLYI